MPETPNLNQGQKNASDRFLQLLLDPTVNAAIITGPGGTGKTFLMGHLIDQVIPSYEAACSLLGTKPLYSTVHMTATTNKAAEVLGKATGRPAYTIHSHLCLRIKTDYQSGAQTLIPTPNFHVHTNEIIFIDESSMADRDLLDWLDKGTQNCFLVFVCDDRQLPPVKEKLSRIFSMDLPVMELTEQMRNSGQPALMALCNQFRDTVLTGNWYDINVVPGVVDYATPEEMPKILEQYFMDPAHNNRIMGYTNARVNEYNAYIRAMRGLPQSLTVGERLIANSQFTVRTSQSRISVQAEDELEVVDLIREPHLVQKRLTADESIEFWGQTITVRTQWNDFLTITVPVDPTHFKQVLQYLSRKKDWNNYYGLQETHPDLRPHDASTTHKAQGSTFDVAVLDLSDLSTCRDPATAARLFYVALSRAKSRVILYGDLAPKYGKIIHR